MRVCGNWCGRLAFACWAMAFLRSILLIAIFATPLHPAAAADVTQLFGKWAGEKAENGNRLVFEFTPTAIASYGVDSSGKRIGDVTPPRDVSYRDLGDSVSIEFRDGSGIMATIRDAKTIVLILPGTGTRELTRLSR
jgi:hypothetical protein